MNLLRKIYNLIGFQSFELPFETHNNEGQIRFITFFMLFIAIFAVITIADSYTGDEITGYTIANYNNTEENVSNNNLTPSDSSELNDSITDEDDHESNDQYINSSNNETEINQTDNDAEHEENKTQDDLEDKNDTTDYEPQPDNVTDKNETEEVNDTKENHTEDGEDVSKIKTALLLPEKITRSEVNEASIKLENMGDIEIGVAEIIPIQSEIEIESLQSKDCNTKIEPSETCEKRVEFVATKNFELGENEIGFEIVYE